MTTKNKRSFNLPKDYLIVTPLTLETCLKEMQALANFDLKVNIKHQSDYHAEVQFVERHNDDLPMYITSRLIAIGAGTCVTFEVSEYLNASHTRRLLKKSQNWQFIIPALMIAGLFLLASQIQEALFR
jgi:hypothetical protein